MIEEPDIPDLWGIRNNLPVYYVIRNNFPNRYLFVTVKATTAVLKGINPLSGFIFFLRQATVNEHAHLFMSINHQRGNNQ